MADREAILRHLSLGDHAFLEALIAERHGAVAGRSLDHAGEALVRLGALAATDGSSLAFHQAVGAALDAGLTPDEVVDALVVLAPVIGSTRVTSIAPKVALAVGYDVEGALEARA